MSTTTSAPTLNPTKLLEAYLRGYALSRARAQIPADELPKSASPSQPSSPSKLAELAAFSLGVGDGPVREDPDTFAGVCVRVTKKLEADAVVIAALHGAVERLKGAMVLGDMAAAPKAS